MVSSQAPEQHAVPAVPEVQPLPAWVIRFINLVNHPQDENAAFPPMRMPNQRQVADAAEFIAENPNPDDGTYYGYAWWHSGVTAYVVYANHQWWDVHHDPRNDSIYHRDWN